MSNRRRVLIVVSSYRPAIVADMQRARMLAWELPKLGWDVEILTPAISEVRQDVIEPDPGPFFNPETPVHEVGSVLRPVFRALGSNAPAFRTFFPMCWRGNQLLKTGRFDLVYFSTATFFFFSLGAIWRRTKQAPYVLDFHDPWVRDKVHYETTKHVYKARLSRWIARFLEQYALRSASALVAVSSQYIHDLNQRYQSTEMSWKKTGFSETIPFGVFLHDFAIGKSQRIGNAEADDQQEIRLHYVGAGGNIMRKSFDLICRTLAQLRLNNVDGIHGVRIKLFGTTYDWKEGEKRFLQEVAGQHGVGDLVAEFPGRVSYRKSLEILSEADGVLVLGVDDIGYMPSKLYSYAASGKPLLACLRHSSNGFMALHDTPSLGKLLWFDERQEMPIGEACEVFQRFLVEARTRITFDRTSDIALNTSMEMARKHDELFRRVLTASSKSGVSSNA
jgi:hypothetical protein